VTRLVLWRHGRTEWNSQRRFQGQTDVPLDAVGETQARAAAAQLLHLPPSRIVSSDLTRARITAQALADATGLDVGVDARLRETYAGVWEGLSREELQRDHALDLAAWAAGSDLRPGGGERRTEVAARMVEAIDAALVGMTDAETLVVVTHGGAARAAVGQLLGLAPVDWAILGVLTNCAWTVLQRRLDPEADDGRGQARWRLEEYNARSLPEKAFADDR
jgi:glucosyl-3-phosphoglycerate phosphatase